MAARITLDAVDGMDDHVGKQVGLRNRYAYRIDQKRHVVGDDVDCRMRGFPPVTLHGRVEYPHARNPGFAYPDEFQHPEDQCRPRFRRTRCQVVRADAAEKMVGESLRLTALRSPEARLDLLDDRVCNGRGDGVCAHGKSDSERAVAKTPRIALRAPSSPATPRPETVQAGLFCAPSRHAERLAHWVCGG